MKKIVVDLLGPLARNKHENCEKDFNLRGKITSLSMLHFQIVCFFQFRILQLILLNAFDITLLGLLAYH